MKTYRRIEITAFRRRVMIVCGDPMTDIGEAGVSVSDADSREMIETASDEGQEILIEAVRLLEETISKQARQEIDAIRSPASDGHQIRN